MNIIETLQFVARILTRTTAAPEVSIIGDRMVWAQAGSRWVSIEPYMEVGGQGEVIAYRITRGLEAGAEDPAADGADSDTVTVTGFMFGGGLPAVTNWIK